MKPLVEGMASSSIQFMTNPKQYTEMPLLDGSLEMLVEHGFFFSKQATTMKLKIEEQK